MPTLESDTQEVAAYMVDHAKTYGATYAGFTGYAPEDSTAPVVTRHVALCTTEQAARLVKLAKTHKAAAGKVDTPRDPETGLAWYYAELVDPPRANALDAEWVAGVEAFSADMEAWADREGYTR